LTNQNKKRAAKETKETKEISLNLQRIHRTKNRFKSVKIDQPIKQKIRTRQTRRNLNREEIIKISKETSLEMTTKTNRNKFFFALLLVVCFAACDSKRVYDSYVSIPNTSWELSNHVPFLFTVKDTLTRNNLFINIRNNADYSFSNLFLITALEFPNGKKIVDTLEYEMTDVSGKFLGKGFTDIKENKLFYKENVVFLMSGDYSLTVSQAMRKNNEVDGIKMLDGIIDVGFRIEKEQ
jgi:gliding motility-associated lipoprotein GldH